MGLTIECEHWLTGLNKLRPWKRSWKRRFLITAPLMSLLDYSSTKKKKVVVVQQPTLSVDTLLLVQNLQGELIDFAQWQHSIVLKCSHNIALFHLFFRWKVRICLAADENRPKQHSMQEVELLLREPFLCDEVSKGGIQLETPPTVLVSTWCMDLCRTSLLLVFDPKPVPLSIQAIHSIERIEIATTSSTPSCGTNVDVMFNNVWIVSNPHLSNQGLPSSCLSCHSIFICIGVVVTVLDCHVMQL